MLIHYNIVLALSYFKEKQNKYIISELMEILGYTQIQMDELLQKLFDEEYICYNEDLIVVTDKGITFLIANDCDDMGTNDKQYNMVRINPEEAMSFEEIYVPEKFNKKYSG